MASTALARVKEMQEKHSATLARARAKATAAVKAQQHTVIAATAAYAIGAAEKRGTELPTIEGVDPKLVYGAGALLAGFLRYPVWRENRHGLTNKNPHLVAQHILSGNVRRRRELLHRFIKPPPIYDYFVHKTSLALGFGR